jgi:hypothetical protein
LPIPGFPVGALFHNLEWCAHTWICAIDCSQLGKKSMIYNLHSLAIVSLESIVFFELPYSFDNDPKLVCSNDFQAGGNVNHLYINDFFIDISCFFSNFSSRLESVLTKVCCH